MRSPIGRALRTPKRPATPSLRRSWRDGGLTGPAPIFEGRNGFFRLVSGPADIDVEGFGRRGVAVPHPPVRHEGLPGRGLCADRDRGRHRGGAGGGRSRPHHGNRDRGLRARLQQAGSEAEKWTPDTRDTADHSLPYIAARAMFDGDITNAGYSPAKLREPRILAFMRRITVKEDPVLTARTGPSAVPTRISATLDDGRRISHEVDDVPGFVGRPMGRADLDRKFRGNVGPPLARGAGPRRRSHALWDPGNSGRHHRIAGPTDGGGESMRWGALGGRASAGRIRAGHDAKPAVPALCFPPRRWVWRSPPSRHSGHPPANAQLAPPSGRPSGVLGPQDHRVQIAADQWPWSAIGRVNIDGISARESCTGTLVAPRRVLTAAHCMLNTPHQRLVQAAGNAFRRRSDARQVPRSFPGQQLRHRAAIPVPAGGRPRFDFISSAMIRYDWAILTLHDALPIKPIPVRAVTDADLPFARSGGEIALAGYAANHPYMLSVHRGCDAAIDAPASGMIAHRCDAAQGNPAVPSCCCTMATRW